MDDLQQLTTSQADKETTVNENFKSVRAAALFGIDYETTTGLREETTQVRSGRF